MVKHINVYSVCERVFTDLSIQIHLFNARPVLFCICFLSVYFQMHIKFIKFDGLHHYEY